MDSKPPVTFPSPVGLDAIGEMIAAGYVMVRKHPELDLYVYNYTRKAQFEWVWNDVTMACRGLILDGEGNLIARPFAKFFNLEHLEQLGIVPDGPFEVYEKLDGSMGTLYFTPDGPAIASRGSFTSEQAVRGTEILRRDHPRISLDTVRPELTYVFEVIYPDNRIVVDYGQRESIRLLAAIDKRTGREADLDVAAGELGVVPVRRFDDIADIDALRQREKDNAEGFVVRWHNGVRAKVKFSDYQRVHSLVTGTNRRRIWEALSEGRGLQKMLDRVPEGFERWVRETEAGLLAEREAIRLQVEGDLASIRKEAQQTGRTDRKTMAELVKKYPNSGMIFTLIDGGSIETALWKLVRPAHENPYRLDES